MAIYFFVAFFVVIIIVVVCKGKTSSQVNVFDVL